MAGVLAKFVRFGRVGRIVPVGHGAAAAIIRDGALVAPPLDYEEPIAPEARQHYEAARAPFAETGSPALPNGLNLGAQLHVLEERSGQGWWTAADSS